MSALLALMGGGDVVKGECMDIDLATIQWLGLKKPKVSIFPPSGITQLNYALKLEDYWRDLGTEASAIIINETEDANKDQIIEVINRSDILYFGGGNIQWYKDIVAKSNIPFLLKSRMQNKEIVISGISTGALFMNPFNINFYGIGLLPYRIGVAVHAQDTERSKQLLCWVKQEVDRSGYALCDKSAIFVHCNNVIKIFGNVHYIKP